MQRKHGERFGNGDGSGETKGQRIPHRTECSLHAAPPHSRLFMSSFTTISRTTIFHHSLLMLRNGTVDHQFVNEILAFYPLLPYTLSTSFVCHLPHPPPLSNSSANLQPSCHQLLIQFPHWSIPRHYLSACKLNVLVTRTISGYRLTLHSHYSLHLFCHLSLSPD